MIKYPLTFKVKAESSPGIAAPWTSQAATFDRPVQLAVPPEFNGPGGGLSPEDLYAMALQNCFVATFKVFAEKSKLVYSRIEVVSQLEVDRNEQGQPWMARILIKVQLHGAEKEEMAKRLLERTSQNCMILNSVNTQSSFEFLVNP